VAATWPSAGPASGSSTSLAAGLVDEVSVHLVPILLGGGVRMFSDAAGELARLDLVESVETPTAVHLRYAVRP
jgi:riboflavin biosynthesis pyrimidine reductase